MDVFEAIKTRRSIRKYSMRLVERDKVLKVLDAARLAPSALNKQPWSFILVSDPHIIDEINYTCFQTWKVPYMVVACSNPEEGWVREDGEEYYKIDAALAMQNLVLEAWELGLGTCWISAFNENDLRILLGIPKKISVIAISPLGYPDEEKESVKNRKTLEEVVHYNTW